MGAGDFVAHPFGVIIDNAPEARPHVGLDLANVLYEAPAEAGIPRILAVFLTEQADRIGPVRSARHYFVQMVSEFDIPLVHIGYSPQALLAMNQLGTVRVDESAGAEGFLRDPGRAAPHNAFISSSAVARSLRDRGVVVEPAFAGLEFGTFEPGPEQATWLRIPYVCCVNHVVVYEYDEGSGRYLRSMGNNLRPHVDGVTGEQYGAESVIVQYADVYPIPDDPAGRLDIDLVGSGEGLLLARGTQVPLRWSKAIAGTATRFERQDGAPFVLPEGQVWVQIVWPHANVEVR